MQYQYIYAIYFSKSNIGICSYEKSTNKIGCSSIKYIYYSAYQQILNRINKNSIIITNQPHHELFYFSKDETFKIVQISERCLDQQIINNNLARIPGTNKIKIKGYITKLKKNQLKYKAIGMILYRLFNQSNVQISQFYIDDIDLFTNDIFQIVDCCSDDLENLQLVKEDIHPSLIKGNGMSKQGYSVLSAFQTFLNSSGSKKVIKYLFMNPTYNRNILQKRLDLIQWMTIHMKQHNKYQKWFRNVHSIQSILKKFTKMNAGEDEWRKITKTLEALIQIKNILMIENRPELINYYVMNENWHEITAMLQIFTSVIQLNPLSIKSGVDQNLDNLRKTYDNMPHLMTILAKKQKWKLDFRIVFMSQVGYLIKINNQTILPLDYTNWCLQFQNKSGKYFSNDLTKQLDQQYGDIFGQIQDIQKKIILQMQSMIMDRQQIILDLYWKISQIECYWGISQVSKNMCKPKYSSQALIISNGWHILLSQNVIHNHSFSFCHSQAPKQQIINSQKNIVNMNYSNRCILITGPNASGKTVYMKQTAIIIYLAHLGFFVPAYLAQIPFIDSIVFIGKNQSLFGQQNCGFQGQLRSLSLVVQKNIISNKSLVLIDQLGSEIDYKNSLKILYATIKYLSQNKEQFLINKTLKKRSNQFQTPLTIIVTHLTQILRGKTVQQNYITRFLTMSVEQDGLKLFKIKPGLVAKGYGIATAAQILPSQLIEISKTYYDLIENL